MWELGNKTIQFYKIYLSDNIVGGNELVTPSSESESSIMITSTSSSSVDLFEAYVCLLMRSSSGIGGVHEVGELIASVLAGSELKIDKGGGVSKSKIFFM